MNVRRRDLVSLAIGIACTGVAAGWLWYNTTVSTSAREQVSAPPQGFEAYNIVALALIAVVTGVVAWWYILEWSHRGGSP